MGLGWTAWLLTLTVRHQRAHALADVFGALRDGWKTMTSGKAWQALKVLGAPEYVRGSDLTWSSAHGWHPHNHVLALFPPGHGDGEATAKAVLARWRLVMGGLGWEASPHAQDARRCSNPAAAARYAVTPAAVYEAVALAKKRSRSARAGLTPFEVLGAAVADADAGEWAGSRPVALWREYVAATKGRRQATSSRGLTLVEPVLADDVVGDVVAVLGRQTLAELDQARRVPELLEAVEVAARGEGACPERTRESVREVLSTLAARDWWLTQPGWQPRRHGPPEPLAPYVPPPPAPPPFPPPCWVSPFLACGRTWRPVRKADLAILVRIDAEARGVASPAA